MSLQLPVAANLSAGGWIILFFTDMDPLTNTSLLPLPWQVAALNQAYALHLTPVVRLGQWRRDYRDHADAGSARRSYHQLASLYARFVAALPLSPTGDPLHVTVGNEFNICGEWSCSDGPGIFVDAATIAAESAYFSRDVLAALAALPAPISSRLHPAIFPLAQTGFSACECVPGGHNPPQDVNGTVFLSQMLAAVPDLYANASEFHAHAYPLCMQPPSATCAGGWLGSYTALRSLARPSWLRNPLHRLAREVSEFPTLITETGYGGAPEADKAVWMVEALQQVFFVDSAVIAVLPFLLAGPFWASSGFPWTIWDATSTHVTLLQPQYLAVQALAARGGC